MNKAELITAIAIDASISKKAAAKVLNSYINTVKTTLKKSEKVGLVGFGTFSVVKRKAREGRHPLTGRAIKIPAKIAVKFQPSKKLGGGSTPPPRAR
jgi:DNA-binding protein HU-beta